MIRIAMLQGKDQRERIFGPEHIRQLEEIGEVVMNEQEGAPTKEQVHRLMAGADIAITSWGCSALGEQELALAPRLQAVLHAAGSVKGVVTPALWQRGIRVTTGAPALGRGVAETALGMTIASLKNMWRLTRETRSGQWQRTSSIRELIGITIGVVGAGSAGRHYIKSLQNFEVDVLVHDPNLSAEAAERMGAVKADLDRLLAASDVVSLHAPQLPETYRMLNRERLALMKDSCILINTARGDLIDEAALVAELGKGRLFACLDVTDPEPPAADHPLRSLPNAVLTPHIAGAVNNGLQRVARAMIGDLKLLLDGKPMSGEVRPEQMSYLA